GGNTPLKERRGDHQPPMAVQRVLLGTQQSHPILCPCLTKPVETALEEVRHSDALIIDAPSLIVKVGCFRTAAEEVAEKEIGQPDLFQSLFQFRTVELRQTPAEGLRAHIGNGGNVSVGKEFQEARHLVV